MKLFLLALMSFSVYADYYKLPYLGAYDGDTIYSEINLPQPLAEVSIRIYGIDTPEKGSRAKCIKEQQLSDTATSYLESLLQKQKYIYVENAQWDKYGGRILGNVYMKKGDQYIEIAPFLLKKGYAIEYYGDKKDHDWCK